MEARHNDMCSDEVKEAPFIPVTDTGVCMCRAYPQSPYNPVRRRKRQLEQRHRQAKRSRQDAVDDSYVRAAKDVYKRACMEARYSHVQK